LKNKLIKNKIPKEECIALFAQDKLHGNAICVPCANAGAVGHSLWRRHEAKAQALGTPGAYLRIVCTKRSYGTSIHFSFRDYYPLNVPTGHIVRLKCAE